MVAASPAVTLPARAGKFAIAAGRQRRPGKFVIYGLAGVGKSTLAAGAPRPLLLCAEDGASELDVDKIVFDESTGRVVPRSLEEATEAIAAITAAQSAHETLVIDGLGALDALVQDWVVRQNPKWKTIQTPGFGQGEAAVLDAWRAFVARVDELSMRRRMRVILVGHSQILKFRNPEGAEFDRYQMAVTTHPKGDVAGFLLGWADLVGFARFETLTAQEGKRTIGVGQGARILHLQRSNAFDAKCRARGVPEFVPLSWDELSDAIRLGQAPARLRDEAERLLAKVDAETRESARAWLAKVGDDVDKLAQAVDRLRGKAMQNEEGAA